MMTVILSIVSCHFYQIVQWCPSDLQSELVSQHLAVLEECFQFSQEECSQRQPLRHAPQPLVCHYLFWVLSLFVFSFFGFVSFFY